LKLVERLEKQVELIMSLVEELRTESSYRGIERLVQVVIQALLDLGLMAVPVLGGRRPSSCSEIGAVLRELGVLDEEYAQLLKAMAGLKYPAAHVLWGRQGQGSRGFEEACQRRSRYRRNHPRGCEDQRR